MLSEMSSDLYIVSYTRRDSAKLDITKSHVPFVGLRVTFTVGRLIRSSHAVVQPASGSLIGYGVLRYKPKIYFRAQSSRLDIVLGEKRVMVNWVLYPNTAP